MIRTAAIYSRSMWRLPLRQSAFGSLSVAPCSLSGHVTGSSAKSSTSLFPIRADASARAFSSAVLRNSSSSNLNHESHYRGEQRRSLFGWGKSTAVKEEPEEVSNANDFGAIKTSEDLSSPSGAASGDGADTTTFSTGKDSTATGTPSMDESAATLVPSFGSSPIQPEEEVLKAATAAAEASSKVEGLPWDPTWYSLPDQVIDIVNYVQDATGMPYAVCIAGITCVIRVAVFPLFVKAQQNTSRMAHMKPEMEALKARMEAMGNVDQEAQVKMSLQMRALFKKYGCNPMKALLVPIVQAPIFMSMFFGLRKMPEYFPSELSTGGVLWFTDLTLADPYYIMPIASAATFIGMLEVGKEQMLAANPQQSMTMLNVFRALGVAMVPITMNFPAAIFCYWMTNNTISLAQSILFKNKAMRKKLGIWDPPQPVPGQAPPKGLIETVKDSMKPSKAQVAADKIRLHNEAVDKQKQAKAGRNRRRGRRNKQ